MNIFISYSTADSKLVSEIAEQLRPHATVTYWDQDRTPGEPVWEMIYEWIDNADLVLTVITDKTVARAMSVGNEIGCAKEKNKPIIPLVTHDVPGSELGCLQGIVYERIDRDNPGLAVEAVKLRIDRLRRKELLTDIFVVSGIVGTIWWASRSK